MPQLMLNGLLPAKIIEQLRWYAQRLDNNGTEQALWERFTPAERDAVADKVQLQYGNGRVAAMWKLARNVSSERAIVDAAYELGWMDAGTQRWLLAEIGELAADTDQLETLFALTDLVIVTHPRQIYWLGQVVEVDWHVQRASWEYFLALAEQAKKGLPADSSTFGEHRKCDYHIKAKSRLAGLPGFPGKLAQKIEVGPHAGSQVLTIPPERIRILNLTTQELLVSDQSHTSPVV